MKNEMYNNVMLHTGSAKKNIKKAEAFDELVSMIQYMDSIKDDRVKVLAPRLAGLVNYFEPKITAKAKKDPFAWVAQACSTDPLREVLNYVYCDKGMLVATDGRRMHWMPAPEGYEDNTFYTTRGDKHDTSCVFPNWRQVIPERGVGTWTMYKRSSISIDGTSRNFRGNKISVTNVKGSTYIDTKYLKEAMSMDAEATMYNHDELSPVLLHMDGERKAVIMPLRMS